MNNTKFDHAYSSWISRLQFWVAIFSVACFAFSTTSAQTLDDWKKALKAANENGCTAESIPYSNLRDEANQKQTLVNNSCKEDNWTCDGLETKSIRQEILGRSNNIEKLKKERDQLVSNKSNAKTDDEKSKIQNNIDKLTKEINDKSRELDFKKKSLETDIKDIEIRIGRGTKCFNARVSVNQVFKNVINKARYESNPDIKPIATQLIAIWEQCKKDHEKQIARVNAGIEKCEKCKKGDL